MWLLKTCNITTYTHTNAQRERERERERQRERQRSIRNMCTDTHTYARTGMLEEGAEEDHASSYAADTRLSAKDIDDRCSCACKEQKMITHLALELLRLYMYIYICGSMSRVQIAGRRTRGRGSRMGHFVPFQMLKSMSDSEARPHASAPPLPEEDP